jgi:WD40 repeat protein
MDYTLKIWNSTDGTVKNSLSYGNYINSLLTLPNGNLACGFSSGIISILDKNGIEKARLSGHSDVILGLTLLPNGELASVSFDRTIKIWSP